MEPLSRYTWRANGTCAGRKPDPAWILKDLPFPVVSKSGRPAIESYVTGNDWKNAKLIELLYCVQGCHRGDGVQ